MMASMLPADCGGHSLRRYNGQMRLLRRRATEEATTAKAQTILDTKERVKRTTRNWLEPLGPSLLVELKRYLDIQRAVYDNNLPFDMWLDVLAFRDMFVKLSKACEKVCENVSLEQFLVRMLEALDAGYYAKLVPLPELARVLGNLDVNCSQYCNEDDEEEDIDSDTDGELELASLRRMFVAAGCESVGDGDEWDDETYDGFTGGDPDIDCNKTAQKYQISLGRREEMDETEKDTICKLDSLVADIASFECWDKDHFLEEFEKHINGAKGDIGKGDQISLSLVKSIFVAVQEKQRGTLDDKNIETLERTVSRLCDHFLGDRTKEVTSISLSQLSSLVNSVSLLWNAATIHRFG